MAIIGGTFAGTQANEFSGPLAQQIAQSGIAGFANAEDRAYKQARLDIANAFTQNDKQLRMMQERFGSRLFDPITGPDDPLAQWKAYADSLLKAQTDIYGKMTDAATTVPDLQAYYDSWKGIPPSAGQEYAYNEFIARGMTGDGGKTDPLAGFQLIIPDVPKTPLPAGSVMAFARLPGGSGPTGAGTSSDVPTSFSYNAASLSSITSPEVLANYRMAARLKNSFDTAKAGQPVMYGDKDITGLRNSVMTSYDAFLKERDRRLNAGDATMFNALISDYSPDFGTLNDLITQFKKSGKNPWASMSPRDLVNFYTKSSADAAIKAEILDYMKANPGEPAFTRFIGGSSSTPTEASGGSAPPLVLGNTDKEKKLIPGFAGGTPVSLSEWERKSGDYHFPAMVGAKEGIVNARAMENGGAELVARLNQMYPVNVKQDSQASFPTGSAGMAGNGSATPTGQPAPTAAPPAATTTPPPSSSSAPAEFIPASKKDEAIDERAKKKQAEVSALVAKAENTVNVKEKEALVAKALDTTGTIARMYSGSDYYKNLTKEKVLDFQRYYMNAPARQLAAYEGKSVAEYAAQDEANKIKWASVANDKERNALGWAELDLRNKELLLKLAAGDSANQEALLRLVGDLVPKFIKDGKYDEDSFAKFAKDFPALTRAMDGLNASVGLDTSTSTKGESKQWWDLFGWFRTPNSVEVNAGSSYNMGGYAPTSSGSMGLDPALLQMIDNPYAAGATPPTAPSPTTPPSSETSPYASSMSGMGAAYANQFGGAR